MMNLSSIEHYIPSSFNYLYNFLIGKDIFYGLLIIAIGILMILFSKYFKYLFLLFYMVFMFIFVGYYFSGPSKLIIIVLVSLLIFMPFLYLALKNGYSMTIINLFMLGYFLILYPFIRSYFNSYIAVSIIAIVIFLLGIMTFFLCLSLKRRIFLQGESV